MTKADFKKDTGFFPKTVATYLVLSFIILFYTVNNFIYIKMSTPVSVDFHEAFRLFKFLRHYKEIESFRDWAIAFRWAPHGPLYNSLAMLPKFFGNLNLLWIRMLNIFWFSVLIIALYELARRLFNRRTAIYGIIIVSLYPVVFADSRLFKQSFGVMGVIVWALISLIASKGFRELKSSLIFGLLFGVSLLVRKTAVVFLLGPVIFTLWDGVREREDRKKALINFMYAHLVFLAVAGYRYFNLSELPYLVALPFEEPVNKFSFEQLSLAVTGIINYQLSLPFFLLFIWGLIYFCRRCKIYTVKASLLSWILIPLLFFMLIPHANEVKNTLPYIPAFALISAFGLSGIKSSVARNVILSAVIISGLAQYYSFTFGVGVPFYKWGVRIYDRRIPYFCHDNYKDPNCSSYSVQKEDIFLRVSNRVLEAIGKESGHKLLATFSHKYNIRSWLVYYKINHYPFKTFILDVSDPSVSVNNLKKSLKESDFLFMPLEDGMFIKKAVGEEITKFDVIDSFEDVYGRGYHLLKRIR